MPAGGRRQAGRRHSPAFWLLAFLTAPPGTAVLSAGVGMAAVLTTCGILTLCWTDERGFFTTTTTPTPDACSACLAVHSLSPPLLRAALLAAAVMVLVDGMFLIDVIFTRCWFGGFAFFLPW